MIFRRRTAAAMLHPPTSPHALKIFLGQLRHWMKQHPDKFDHIACSIAMQSLAHFSVTRKLPVHHQEKAVATAAVILKHFVSQPVNQTFTEDDCAISNVFWACARLKLRPDDVHQGSEDNLALRYRASAGQANLLSLSVMLWSCSTLRINPLQGKLLESLVDGVQRVLPRKELHPASNMQTLSLIMHSFANMGFRVHASIAESIITQIYEGLARGRDEP